MKWLVYSMGKKAIKLLYIMQKILHMNKEIKQNKHLYFLYMYNDDVNKMYICPVRNILADSHNVIPRHALQFVKP